VGTPKAMLRKVQGQITPEGWRQVREGIEVKLVRFPGSEQSETLILCRSEDRATKESAMLERFVKRMEEGLEKLARSAECGRLKDLTVAHERLGRLRERNWRAAACFQVSIAPLDRPAGKARLSVRWTKDEQAKRLLCGCYLLRTNIAQADPVKLWQEYIQLVDAEWAFRISKDELELRPVFHQHRDRVLGHILVCFTAYAMWKALSGWMRASGLGDAPRPLVEELSRLQSGEVALPTRGADGAPGAMLLVRCVGRPEEHQAVLLNRLGLRLPQQLSRFRLREGDRREGRFVV
jgi:hypothetical protein